METSTFILCMLLIALSVIVNKPIIRKFGYGSLAGMTFIIICVFLGSIFYELSKFIEIIILNYFIASCISIKIIYELFILENIPEEDREEAERDQDDIDFCCGKFISEIDTENRMKARIKINEKVFGKYAWDNFPDF
jgi:hypothetical protein